MDANAASLLAPYQLAGKFALVTGGTSGIGRACVERLHAYGATVAYTYVNGIETAAKAHDLYPGLERVSAHPIDLRDAASIKACMQEVIAHYGQIDILVNNAAVGSATVKRFSDDPGEQDRLMLGINADGTLKMCQSFLAELHALPSSRRKIINISSVGGGINVFPGFRLSDGMSKAAVAFMTKQLAAEHTQSALDIFAVCPGATNTAMFQQSTLDHLSPASRTAFLDSLPKHRLIEPAEIAAIVHFLATDLSSPMHGAIIDASMGLGVRPGLMTESQSH